MDATEAHEERLKAKAAREAAKAKYDAVPPANPAHKHLEKDWLRAEAAFAQAHLNLVIAQGIPGEALEAAKAALARADRELDKFTSVAAAPAGLSKAIPRALT
jgi:hypothetical protein